MITKIHVNSWNNRTCVVDTAVLQFMHSPTVCWFLLDHPKQKKAKTISTSLAIIDSSQEKTFYSVWHAASPMLTQKYAISAVIALNFTHLSAFLLCKRGNKRKQTSFLLPKIDNRKLRWTNWVDLTSIQSLTGNNARRFWMPNGVQLFEPPFLSYAQMECDDRIFFGWVFQLSCVTLISGYYRSRIIMGLLTTNHFCCCFSLRTGGLVVGYFGLISAVLGTIGSIAVQSATGVQMNCEYPMWILKINWFWTLR